MEYNNVNETAGEFLYDNGVLFNGKGFDAQRDIKHVRYTKTLKVLYPNK